MVSGSDMSVADDTYDEKVDYQMEMDEYERIQGGVFVIMYYCQDVKWLLHYFIMT